MAANAIVDDRDAQALTGGVRGRPGSAQPTHCRRLGGSGALCGALLFPQAGEAAGNLRERDAGPIRYVCAVGHSTYVPMLIKRSGTDAAEVWLAERAARRRARLAGRLLRPDVKTTRPIKWPRERIEALRVAWNRGEDAAVLAARFGLLQASVTRMVAWFRRQGYDFVRCQRGKGTSRLCGWVRG